MGINHRLKNKKCLKIREEKERKCSQCLVLKNIEEFPVQRNSTFNKENDDLHVRSCYECRRKRQKEIRIRVSQENKKLKRENKLSDISITKKYKKSMGHVFGDKDLNCTNEDCGRAWKVHQNKPLKCNNPKHMNQN